MGKEMIIKAITTTELLHIRDVLLSMLEEGEDCDLDEVHEALLIVEALIEGQEVMITQDYNE